MENVSFRMDLLRLASSIAQQEQSPGSLQPLLAETLAQLADAHAVSLQTSDAPTIK